MQKRWFIKNNPSDIEVAQLVNDVKVSPLMARLLHQRELKDFDTITSFFKPNLDQLHDPFLMLNLREAAEQIKNAIEQQQHIVVFGDYDVDGTTAVALVYSVLQQYTNVSYYIPDRYEEGYGLSYKGIDTALERGASLLIALDCGIKEVEKVAYAKEKGLPIIVCDHHTPGDIVPDCLVLDPKQDNCRYPFKELCGCGVGFKLMHGLLHIMGESDVFLLQQLDLVAIAIGADIVSLSGENRVLCKLGLKQLNEQPRIGIQALVQQAKKVFPLDLSNVVFIIAPRINAAGRLDSGQRSVALLLADSEKLARSIAVEIDEYNSNRRLLDAQMTEEALALIAEDELHANRKSTVVFQADWHKGVVGIVASRLIEKHYRPTIVLTESNGVATGSARSVLGFSVYDAIESCAHLITQFGGHQYAAGLTLPLENVSAFREAFDAAVQDKMLLKDEVEELIIDVEIGLADLFLAGESVHEVPRIYKMLAEMEPFGPDNPKPVFVVRSVYAASYCILKEAHLKVALYDPVTKVTLPAIGFNLAEKADLVAAGCAFDCAFTLETNTWNNQTTLQLQIRDIREGS